MARGGVVALVAQRPAAPGDAPEAASSSWRGLSGRDARVAALLDCLAREMGGSASAAVLGTMLDGGSAVSVVGAKHRAPVDRVSSTLAGAEQ